MTSVPVNPMGCLLTVHLMKKPLITFRRSVVGLAAVAAVAGTSATAHAVDATTTTTAAPTTTVAATTTTVSLLPSAPLNMKVRVKGTTAILSWSAPASAGMHPVLGYTVDSSNEELSCYTTKLTCNVSPLVPGIPYKFRVRADSSEGLGALSEWSRQVTLPFNFEGRGRKITLTDASKPSVKISLHTGINVVGRTVYIGVMTPRGLGSKQIVSYAFELVDANKTTVATFSSATHRENVVICRLVSPAGRYQVHITAIMKSGAKLTWHGVWVTVK
ncbi:MAG: Fibronectin type domain [Actinomycetota bacterium]